MKKFSEQLQKKAVSLKLKAGERKELRERVLSYMEYHPLPAELRTVAMNKKDGRVTALPIEPFRAVPIAWKEFFQLGAITAAILLVVVPVVAEHSVPGDTLYAVKVHVNEEVRSSLTWGAYERVEWEATRLNRRLEEARLLAEEGRLTEAADAEVAKAVREHTETAQSEIAALGVHDTEAAAIASIEFDSALSAHANAFAAKPATSSVAIAAAVADAERSVEVSTSSVPAYDKLMARVEQNTTRVYELLEQLRSDATVADEVLLTDVTRRFTDIERSVLDAIALREDDELAARAQLVDVLVRSQRLAVYLTNLAVRQSMSVEDMIPVRLTPEEQAAVLNELRSAIQTADAKLATAESAISKPSVADKLTVARVAIASSTANDGQKFPNARSSLQAVLELATDALQLADQYVRESEAPTVTTPPNIDRATTSTTTPVVPPTIATSTELSSSTNVLEIPTSSVDVEL